LRVGLCRPALRIADVDANVRAIGDSIEKAAGRGVQVLAFPELSVTAYTLGDLVQHQVLLQKAEQGLAAIADATRASGMLVIVGAPLVVEKKIFNCAVALAHGHILGVVPKSLVPNYKEFYEARWFSPASYSLTDRIQLAGRVTPFGSDVLFRLSGNNDALVGVEVCEDLWLPLAPHERAALCGATILINISASNEILGKADWRRAMAVSESGRCVAAYCYVSAGMGESSNDVIYGGHALIAENGTLLRESARLTREPEMVIADIDVERLGHDRRVMTTFADQSARMEPFQVVDVDIVDPAAGRLERAIDPHPFVPSDPARRAERCRDIFSMQVAALAQKMTGANQKRLALGVSGGLDSTLALLVGAKTMDYLALPRTNLNAFTMPGFGTTARTKRNAVRLCQALTVTLERVDIVRASQRHLRDLGRGDGQEDVVFENVQARYRTEFLFNKANQIGAMNLGTGDLTEIALGWSTFSGDQMSHYHVNASVPKTLVRYLVRWVADEELADTLAQKALYDVLETPISPELRRPQNGVITQKSEEVIGPVELADFYLYPFVRFGARPGKILYLADQVSQQGLFDARYSLDDLDRWLKSFVTRFFANQFKRTAMPEGPKVGSVSLSPRGDWRMPSDASPALWLEDLEQMHRRLHG